MTTDTARSNEKDIKETRSLTTAANWSGQGRENTRDLLKANPKLAEKLGARCEKTAKPVGPAADAAVAEKGGAGGAWRSPAIIHSRKRVSSSTLGTHSFI